MLTVRPGQRQLNPDKQTGAVFLDVGRIVFERGAGIVFQAGPHQLFDGDFEALCAAME